MKNHKVAYCDQILNIPPVLDDTVRSKTAREFEAYDRGHRDVRYVAAEIAIHADKRIEDLEKALRNARSLLTAYVGTKTSAESVSNLFKQMSDALGE